MVTSGMTFAVHHGCTSTSSRSRYCQRDLINDFGSLRMVDRQSRNQPVIYVAVATWIPSCNMYQLQNDDGHEDIDKNVLSETKRAAETKQIFEPGGDPETEEQENIVEAPIKAVEEFQKECSDNSDSKDINPDSMTEKQDAEDQKTLNQVSSNGHTENLIESKSSHEKADVTDIKRVDGKAEEAKEQEDNRVSSYGHTEKSNESDHVPENVHSKNIEETNSLAIQQTVSSDGCTEETNEHQEEKVPPKTTPEMEVDDSKGEINTSQTDESILTDDSPTKVEPSKEGSTVHKSKAKLVDTVNRLLSPKQLKKKQESDTKRMEKQKEKEERDKKRNEERERAQQEKLKKIEEKQKEKQMKIEQKKKEKEEKEEQKRKEKEEKEKMRKEKEEREEQKRKEREQEKLKKQQEIEEKHREKQKEEEKKQKAAMAFVNFFVPIKSDGPTEEEKKMDDRQAFKTFEVKSDMKLPPLRRNYLTERELSLLDRYLEEQDETVSYLTELKQGKSIGTSSKTWPVEDTLDDDVMYVETDSDLGETVHEDKKQNFRAKFLKFHDNRRPAYFGTWRKRSRYIKPRKPMVEDIDYFNYEEDSDDDWEEEEQGESLNGSDDEADKENEDEKDDYEIDNDFFVPHGHLSDDEIDDEEEARLAPELMKQKLKLLKDEFEQDMKCKTHKLKPRYIGCVWYNKDGSNVDEAIDRYLNPLAMMAEAQIVIKARHTVLTSRKEKPAKTLDPQYIPIFIKVIHGNTNKQKVIIEEFLTLMANTGYAVEMPKSDLLKNLKKMATWKKCKEGSLKNKYCWLINEDLKEKYGVDLK